MIHEHIKAIARRSLVTDRVLFGESKKQHPLGFDGFNIDNSIDAALLQLTASNYSTVTALHMECVNITRMLKETAEISCGTKIARLYKESRVTDSIKKVIAFISKAIKFIFVDLPKKIYNKIKSLFTKKKRDVNVAKQTAESTEKNIKAMEENMDAMSEAMRGAASRFAAQETAKFEAWKAETLKELHDLDKVFETLSKGNAKEADELADSLIKKAKDTESEIDTLRAELTDGLDDYMVEVTGTNDGEKIYRNMELQDMAIDTLERIAKEKRLVKKIKSMAFDNDSFKLWMASIIKAGADHKHMNLYVVNAMLRLVPVPYVNSVVAKYVKDKRNMEIFGFGIHKPASHNGVLELLLAQTKSLRTLASNLTKDEWINFDIIKFDDAWVRKHSETCFQDGDGWKIHSRLLYTIGSEEYTDKVTIRDRMQLNKLMSNTHSLLVDTEHMDSAIEELKKITSASIASKMGVSEEEMTSDNFKEKLHQELNSVMSLINSAVKLKNGIAVGALKCVNSLISAEDTLLGAIIINDDKLTATTIGQLSQYIAGDENMMKRVWAILKKA